MGHDLLDVIEHLRREQLVPPGRAEQLARLASRRLVPVYSELRIALYAGVLLLSAGVGLLVREHLSRLGPLAVATAVGLAALLCFLWVRHHAAPFGWGERPVSHLAFDYILLLGALLGSADLAYVEAQFTPLGADWPWHLLLVALLMALAAFRYDSRVLFSLALSSFAAWRGVSVSLLENALWHSTPGWLRANALGCGALFLALGVVLWRTGRKPHFEPSATYLGWITILGALLSGIGTQTGAELAYSLVLLATGALVAALALRRQRFPLFALGLLGSYIALSALFHRSDPRDTAVAFWYALSSLALLGGLLLAHRRFKEGA